MSESIVRVLDLSRRGIKTIEEKAWAGRTWDACNLSYNEIRTLPSDLATLTTIKSLDLSYNQLRTFPDCIFTLKNLEVLRLRGNLLAKIPPEIGKLKNLRQLDMSYNQIEGIPDSLVGLDDAEFIDLRHNKLGKHKGQWLLPPNLLRLYLDNNQLDCAPLELGQLERLKDLRIKANPLTFPPEEVVQRGNFTILHFLRNSAIEKEDRYDVKLMLLGDGGEGKTCLSRALRGLPFQINAATQGIEINTCSIKHAEHKEAFRYRIWDFEGQEINHQSHQFFLTQRAIYILVMNGRRPVRENTWEYWLSTIVQRAPEAKVLMVLTQCEERTPMFDPTYMVARFGAVLPENFYFFVGCSKSMNIPALKRRIADLTHEQKLAPQSWPRAYLAAERAVENAVNQGVFIFDRSKLQALLQSNGVPNAALKHATSFIAELGVFTHFPDSRELSNFIVLDPQWLTKAVSQVLEHKRLIERQGEIRERWLRTVWGLDSKYRTYCHELYHAMREFELCYGLDNNPGISLAPLRFPSLRPSHIPWTLMLEDSKQRIAEYRFGHTPPAGIMSRFIVKAHQFIVTTELLPFGVYWSNGVFLKATSHGTTSEALCEYDQERRWFRLTVRSSYPQNFGEQLHHYILAIFKFFKGLAYQRFYGCTSNGDCNCDGLHPEKKVAMALSRNYELVCEDSAHLVSPADLVEGYHSFGESSDAMDFIYEGSLENAQKAIDEYGLGFRAIWGRMKKLAEQCKKSTISLTEPTSILRLQQIFREYFFSMDLDEENHTPCIFTLSSAEEKPGIKWNLKNYNLRFFCEDEIEPHPFSWTTHFKLLQDQWEQMAPYLRILDGLLSLAYPFKAKLEERYGPSKICSWRKVSTEFQQVSKLRREIDNSIEAKGERGVILKYANMDGASRKYSVDEMATDHFLTARRILAENMSKRNSAALEEHSFDGLARILMPDGGYRWLCPHHAGHFFGDD